MADVASIVPEPRRHERASCLSSLRAFSAASVTSDMPEVQALQREAAGVGLEQIAEVERAVAALHADVVGEVHRAVDVDVDVVRVVVGSSTLSGILKPVTSPVTEMFGTT